MHHHRYEVFIIAPNGKRFRSKNELRIFFEKTGEKRLDPEDFDFSPFGNYRSSPDDGSVATSSPKVSLIDLAALSEVNNQYAQTEKVFCPSQPIQVNSRTSAVVAMPGVSPAAVILNSATAAVTANNPMLVSRPALATSHVQNIQEPLSQGAGAIPVGTVSQAATVPSTTYKSQLSQEAEDADEQISQLLDSMHRDTPSMALESDKIADLMKSIGSLSPTDVEPPPVTITKAAAVSTATTLKPASVTKPELTAGTTGFQASFLNSLANRRLSAEDDPYQPEPSPPSPDPPAPQVLSPPMARVEGTVPSSLPTSSSLTTPSLPTPSAPVSQLVTMGGGAASQMRALQNLPPNTRLVKGPNGQYTLQKIQTIELSQEMQQVSFETVRVGLLLRLHRSWRL